MLLEKVTSLLYPLLVVPQLPGFGLVPSSVGCKNSFHFEFDEALYDVARTPDRLNAIARFVEIVRLKEPIELVVGFEIIFRAHERVKELRSGPAGFVYRSTVIARDEYECVVTAHRNTVLCSPLVLEVVSDRSHSETWVGCIVSVTTSTRSPLNASRSVSSRSFIENPSSVFVASYLLL